MIKQNALTFPNYNNSNLNELLIFYFYDNIKCLYIYNLFYLFKNMKNLIKI